MSTGLKITVAVLGVFFLFTVGIVGTFVGTNNELVSLEQSITAQYDQNKNNYDNFFKSVKEVAQVPSMYVDDMKKVYDSAIKGRYGEDGSKAMFSFIKEHNPNFDASLYTKIQQVIQSGRKDFELNQKMLIDKKRLYQTNLRKFPSNIVAGVLGFPKIDLNKFNIVTSDATEKAFIEGKSEPMTIRGN